MKHTCPHCNIEFEVKKIYLNRANKIGAPRYCSKKCSGLARRYNKTREQRISEKSEYDRQYREKNRELIKQKKHEHFIKTYDPTQAALDRKKTMPRHIEYCRRPEYKANKITYDMEFRAKKLYGENWESAILIQQINKKLVEMADKAELRTIQGTNNKSKKRKRQWLKLMKILPQLT